MRHVSGDLEANPVIIGDFNEGQPVGSDGQALAVLFQAKPPMVDALSTLSGRISTYTDGKAYDRILLSDGIAKGLNRLVNNLALCPVLPAVGRGSVLRLPGRNAFQLRVGFDSVAEFQPTLGRCQVPGDVRHASPAQKALWNLAL